MNCVIAALQTRPHPTDAVQNAALPLIHATRAEKACAADPLHADIAAPNPLVCVRGPERRIRRSDRFLISQRVARCDQPIRAALRDQRLEIIDLKPVKVN